jgi:predicted hydrocarbon binding protein
MEEVMGRNGVSAALNMAGLGAWVGAYPPDDMQRGVDFAEVSAINQALEEMYGPRAGRNLARRSAWATFKHGVGTFGAFAGLGDLALKVVPLSAKLKVAIPALARVFTETSDQETTVDEMDDAFLYIIHRCPMCWGRRAEAPVCSAAVGLLEEGLRWVSGGRSFQVEETRCIAMGDEVCELRIEKEPRN